MDSLSNYYVYCSSLPILYVHCICKMYEATHVHVHVYMCTCTCIHAYMYIDMHNIISCIIIAYGLGIIISATSHYIISGMDVVGIFRRAPATATVHAIKEQFNLGNYLPAGLSVCLSVCLSVHPSVSICLSVCLSVCLSAHLIA